MNLKTLVENITAWGFDPEKVNIEIDGVKISRYEVVVDSSGSFVLRFMRDERPKPIYREFKG